MKLAWHALGVGVCLPLMAAACTRNFSEFHFGPQPGPETRLDPSASAPIAGVDAQGNRAGTHAGAGNSAATLDAAITTSGAQPAAPAAWPQGGMGSSAMPDAASPGPEPGGEDAGSELLSAQCSAGWSDANIPGPYCRLCACSACVAEVNDCVALGTLRERMVCGAVLSCAVQHQCQDYDCYCATPGCGMPSSSGDGPCVGPMNAAAGGPRMKVMSLRAETPPNRVEPLVRAALAISCLYGTNALSPGPAVVQHCATSCR